MPTVRQCPVNFEMKKYFMEVICHKNTYFGRKAICKVESQVYLFPCPWTCIRIRIPNTDPEENKISADPDPDPKH
jgi:hypothetical protein